MRTSTFFSGLFVSNAARVDHFVDLSTDMEMLSMAQSVAMANGFLNMSANAQVNPLCDTIWPKSLDKEFTGKFVVGSGATACVYLAKDETNTLVAVKVGKSANGKAKAAALASWKAECSDMQSMRMKGCRAGKDMLALHEAYLPTCTKVGPHEKGAYYVMHAAGTKGIKDVPDLGFSNTDRKTVFAELVASIYALHAVDLTHNDLHGTNIVLDGTQLALIDFGSLKTLERSWKRDYKRDSSAIWRWGAVLANCAQGAQWPNPPTAQAGKKFVECMNDFSGGEASFMTAVRKMVNGCVAESKEHGVEALYKSKFVQGNLPPLKRHYPWSQTGDCLSWSEDKWEKFKFDEDFPGYVKCDTVPTYEIVKRKEKKGKVRVTRTNQCSFKEFNSACWSKTPGKIWSCGGCSTGNIAQGSDGGCIFSTHPLYKYAADFK